MLEKTVTIGDKEVRFRSSATIPIVSHIELPFNYCLYFYDCQFVNARGNQPLLGHKV